MQGGNGRAAGLGNGSPRAAGWPSFNDWLHTISQYNGSNMRAFHMMVNGWRGRAPLAILLASGLLAAWFVAPLTAPAQREMAPFSGTLLYRRDGDLWQLNLATNEQRLFLRPDRGLVN